MKHFEIILFAFFALGICLGLGVSEAIRVYKTPKISNTPVTCIVESHIATKRLYEIHTMEGTLKNEI